MVLMSRRLGRLKGNEVRNLGAEHRDLGTGYSPARLRRLLTWYENRLCAHEHSPWKCHASRKLAEQVHFVCVR